MPPLLKLFHNQAVQDQIQIHLRQIALSPKRILIVFLLACFFEFFDSLADLRIYVLYQLNPSGITSALNRNVFDWELAFLAQQKCPSAAQIGIIPNLLLYVCANLSEFLIVIFAFTSIGLVLQHNLFFLSLIYQRERQEKHPHRDYFVIDFFDQERSFGLRPAHKAFNIQIFSLAIAGCFILITRYAHVSNIAWPEIEFFEQPVNWFTEVAETIPVSALFPTFGQIAAAITWFVAFAIVLLPSMVKFLPLLSSRVRTRGLGITSYLRQFIPPDDTQEKYQMETDEQVEKLASYFAQNSFWPGGDDVARFILYFVSFVLLIILLPIDFRPLSPLDITFALLFLMTVSVSISTGILWMLRQALRHIDHRLVSTN